LLKKIELNEEISSKNKEFIKMFERAGHYFDQFGDAVGGALLTM
jgi:hypothetical protein